MHDPSTVAHEIRWPWKSQFGIRPSIITIWHEDPLKFEGKCGCRDDDSCGWHRPPMTHAERDEIKKLADRQYSDIFRRQTAERDGASYAYICHDATCHEAIYWSWRAIKHLRKPCGPWMYGCNLTRAEEQFIFELASNPVDSLKFTHAQVKDAETFSEFFMCIYRAYCLFHRPWYRHPRWHVHHWRIQWHFWQTFRRWAFSRCAGCGKGFAWGECPTSFSWDKPKTRWFRSEVGSYHGDCANMTAALHKAHPEGRA